MDKNLTPGYVDITPTWAGVLPMLLALVTDGNAEGRDFARSELRKMAKAADMLNTERA